MPEAAQLDSDAVIELEVLNPTSMLLSLTDCDAQPEADHVSASLSVELLRRLFRRNFKDGLRVGAASGGIVNGINALPA